MSEPTEQGPAYSVADVSRDADSDMAVSAKRTNRWSFLRCLATWMPGGSGGMAATGTHIWTHLKHEHD